MSGDGRIWLRGSLNLDRNSTMGPGWTVERTVRSNRSVFRKKVLVFRETGGGECVLAVAYFEESDLERLLDLGRRGSP